MTAPDSATSTVPRVTIKAPVTPEFATILTPEALTFLATLHREFNERRVRLLEKRVARQAELDAGARYSFLPETREIRESAWTVAPIPPDLQDRRVEITGPVDRKMIINALNSGARVFMADFEDANSPTWENCIQGQINLYDAVRREISFTNPDGKEYRLNEKTATLLVRPRGWHLVEKHVEVDGTPISGSLFDFGLYFFHNAKELIQRGSGPYFYLPKMESHQEARLWNDVFVRTQELVGLPNGTIRATALIETLPATFELHEILWELRDHSAGLNCGRWDYIFSAIKKRRHDSDFILPDRAQVTMTTPFMRGYSQLVIKTCHQRGIHAMGGMSAFIPVKGDEALNEKAFAQVRADKEREVGDGHDGTWVAHPGMVALATEVFDQGMPQPNQISRQRDDVNPTAAELLATPEGTITEQGLRTNIRVGVQYIAAWLGGQGAVPLYNLMEDAATAEISRAQVWQWIRHPRGVLDDGRKVTVELYRQMLEEEMGELRAGKGQMRFQPEHLEAAREIFDHLSTSDEFVDFLTLPAYGRLR
jgi:malate synthase